MEISKVSLIMQQNRYWATGDTTGFLALAPDVSSILDKAVASFLKDGLHVGWFGWDDRVGNGFCGACNQEVQLAFAALVIRACRDFSVSLRHAGDATNATRYNSTASELSRRLRTRPAATGEEFYDDYGLHAAANLINAAVTTRTLSTDMATDVAPTRLAVVSAARTAPAPLASSSSTIEQGSSRSIAEQ
eukprot:COSAG01_NODE_12237_length_1776_cov_1.472868_1_plen_190_part_00